MEKNNEIAFLDYKKNNINVHQKLEEYDNATLLLNELGISNTTKDNVELTLSERINLLIDIISPL